MSDSHVLSSYEELLRRPDFILEPKCWDTIVKYIKAGGKPDQLVECLADSYVGYAQMASLVCHWLRIADDRGSGGAAAAAASGGGGVVSAVLEAGQGAGGGSGTGGATGGGGVSSSSAQRRSNAGPLSAVPDEFTFLKKFTMQKFDSSKVAGVFQRYGGKPPPWMERLTQDARGRQLIYELSAVHRNCLLLNYGIQKTLMQGHEDEVATVGSSLASYFSVFHRLLAARLRAMVLLCCDGQSTTDTPNKAGLGGKSDGSGGAADGSVEHATPRDPSAVAEELSSLARELVEGCGHSLHTFLHAQQLLHALARHPRGGPTFARLGQELEIATAATQPAVWAVTSMLLPMDATLEDATAAATVGSLLAASSAAAADGGGGGMLATGTASQDLQRLAAMYRNGQDVRVAPIQHPLFIQLLITGLFTPGKLLPADVSNSVSELLARATCVRDNAGDDRAAAIRMSATRSALQAALQLGQRAQGKMMPEDAMPVYEVTEIPVACVGLLHLMKCYLGARDYYHEAASHCATPVYARLAIFVACKRPELLHLVTDLIRCALSALGSQRAELARVFLDAIVELMRATPSASATRQLLTMVDAWAAEADPSQMRYLLMQLLRALAPPYSPSFAAWLLRHMTVSGISRHRNTQSGSAAAGLLSEFATVAAGLAFTPPLGQRELALLQELRHW